MILNASSIKRRYTKKKDKDVSPENTLSTQPVPPPVMEIVPSSENTNMSSIGVVDEFGMNPA
jgi:hypothetical protein